MKHLSAVFFSLVLAAVQVSVAAAAPSDALSPSDQAAAKGLATQIEADVCQAGSTQGAHCTPLACTAANTNLQQQIQQLIIASGLQPNVVLAALRDAQGVLPPPENVNSPSCEFSAINSLEQTVIAQIGGNKPAGAGGGGGSQNGSPAFATTQGTAND